MKRFLIASLASVLFCAISFAQTDSVVYRLEPFRSAVYYTAPSPLTEKNPCEVAVIVVHGWNGGVRLTKNARTVQTALPDAYVISPMFPTKGAFIKRKVEYDGRATWNDSWDQSLKVPGLAEDDWRAGGDANGTKMSSFDCIDRILTLLSDRKNFPNLRRVVLAGFSGGGQFVSRYVAVGKGKVRKGVTLDYVSMSPSTDFRFERDVPWLWGLKDRPRYSASLSEKKIMENLCSRRCWKGCGDKDVKEKSLDMTPWAMDQGVNRYDRFLNLEKYLDKYPDWKAKVSFHTFVGLAHESDKAYMDATLLRFIIDGDMR